MKAKSIDLLNNTIDKVAHTFAVSHKVNIMGSNGMRGMIYPSDFDFVSEIEEGPKALAHHLQKLFSKPLPFYFIDFKAGRDKSVKDGKLRWTPETLKKGINKGIRLEDALKEDMLIKLDYIQHVGNSFFECSIIFETKNQIPKTIKEIESELEQDVIEYSKTNKMKAMKRIYSLLKLHNKHPEVQNELIKIFNSEYGLVNKLVSDLEVLHQLKNVDIMPTLQMIKAQLGNISWIQKSKVLLLNNKSNISKEIKYLRNKLNHDLTSELKYITKQII
jgi:CRISPR/Cas system-associated endoribonuclease Cas2